MWPQKPAGLQREGPRVSTESQEPTTLLGWQWKGVPAEVQRGGNVCSGIPPEIPVSDGSNDYMCG